MVPLQILGPEVIVPVVIFMIPIVAILTSHQQKMARIIHGDGGNNELRGEVEALRQEVAHLRSVVNTQTLALDSLTQTQKQLSASQESLTTRLS